MKLLTALALFSASTLCAQDSPPQNRELIERLFTAREPADFAQTLAEAKQQGLAQQALLEAQFLYYIDAQDYPAIADMADQLAAVTFSPDTSEIFTLEEDWRAITLYSKSLKHLANNERAAFKKAITEAFWLSPRQAAVYAPHIEKLRLQTAMANLKMDSNLRLPNLSNDQTTPLIDKKKSATFLYFWSPWSREFDETLEDFKQTNKALKAANIQVIAVLAESAPEVEADAREFIKEEKITDSSHWVKDTKSLILAKSLRLRDVPTVVVLTPDAKVQFNGHPSDPALWHEIKKIAPDFKRPSLK